MEANTMKKTTTLFLMLAVLAFGAIFAGFNYPTSPPSAEKVQTVQSDFVGDIPISVVNENLTAQSSNPRTVRNYRTINQTKNFSPIVALTSRKNIREVFAENYRENYKGKHLVPITRKTKFSNLNNFDNERFDGFGVDVLARAKV